MSILTAGRTPALNISRTRTTTQVAVRLLGAALALAVAYIHVKDQGGFPGEKTPSYVGVGYYLLEVAGVIAAVALLVERGRRAARAWFLAMGVAAGPLLGYVLSRGPGLPGYTDDKGVWTEQLGVISVVVETALLILAITMWARTRSASD